MLLQAKICDLDLKFSMKISYFKAKEKIGRVGMIDNPTGNSSFSHEKFMFFTPKGRDSKDPSNFSRDDFTNLENLRNRKRIWSHLLFKLFQSFISDEF